MVWVSADRHPVVERSDPMEELMANITARKKLGALYARGIAVRFGEDGPRYGDQKNGSFSEEDVLLEDEIEIWVAPPNPHQREMAMREAQASRARSLLRVKSDENSEEYLTTKAYLAEMDIVTLTDYLVIATQEERTQAAIREILAKAEWENIDELRDAMAQFDEAADAASDPEWQSLLERDIEYGKQVAEVEARLADEERVSLSVLDRDDLEKRGMERRKEIVGSQAFIYEYERQMKFYAVREPGNHATLFFENAKELTEQDELIQIAISEALTRFIKDGSEAKN